MSTFAAIVTCHEADPSAILACLGGQTRAPEEVLLGWSGTSAAHEQKPGEPLGVMVTVSEDEKDFGYQKRNRLVAQARADFVGFFCQDDSYHPEYIERMMALAAPETDVVWCPWSDIPGCKFQGCSSTLGNFIIRRELFLKLGGFPAPVAGKIYTAKDGRTFPMNATDWGLSDARLIDKALKETSRIEKQPFMLYFHNVPFDDRVKATSWGKPVKGVDYAEMLRFSNYQIKQATQKAT